MFASRQLFNIKRVTPLLDRVLIERCKAVTKTSTGIFLPEKSVEKLPEGIVIAVGPGKVANDGKQIPMNLKPGDRVLLPSYGGSSVKIDSKNETDYLLMHESEILAKLE
ncbi:10 kDa heat shock protein, mitochondrial [Zancudomyces culisetae]|uniref:10 kDa heat shock protein, mitochondrial n=1 Tax=Zancudomyces culisetae TaxID=1213189 RepID=A0A1R1PKS0_ZANCU|nr:10 kDa heat shock protein, mitochondrial [Zancudomyces culisetae]|eukprot:OMH81578.1 10 kDa heat shock protein, mitochondrial [Zancudomyces culisetae]